MTTEMLQKALLKGYLKVREVLKALRTVKDI